MVFAVACIASSQSSLVSQSPTGSREVGEHPNAAADETDQRTERAHEPGLQVLGRPSLELAFKIADEFKVGIDEVFQYEAGK